MAERISDARRREIAEWLIEPNTFRLAEDAAEHFGIERSTVYKIKKEHGIGTERVGRRLRSVSNPPTTDAAKRQFSLWLANNLRETDVTLSWAGVILRVREEDQVRVLRLARDAALDTVAAITDLHITDSVCFFAKLPSTPNDVADHLYQLAAAGRLARGRDASA
jgi:hypothetical protein